MTMMKQDSDVERGLSDVIGGLTRKSRFSRLVSEILL